MTMPRGLPASIPSSRTHSARLPQTFFSEISPRGIQVRPGSAFLPEPVRDPDREHPLLGVANRDRAVQGGQTDEKIDRGPAFSGIKHHGPVFTEQGFPVFRGPIRNRGENPLPFTLFHQRGPNVPDFRESRSIIPESVAVDFVHRKKNPDMMRMIRALARNGREGKSARGRDSGRKADGIQNRLGQTVGE